MASLGARPHPSGLRLHLLPRALPQLCQHMSMAMATPAPKRVSKACDACKLRKVKCNGQERCQQCSHLGLRCVYSVSVRTRSQGKRGRIISEYKNKTTNATAVSMSILPASEVSLGQSSPLGGMQYPVDQLECEHSSRLDHMAVLFSTKMRLLN